MKETILIFLILVSPSVFSAPDPDDPQFAETFVHTMEMARRVQSNGSSYQHLKRCGANEETLKGIKKYLYQDIAKAHVHYPKSGVDVDGLFAMGSEAGDTIYDSLKGNKTYCAGLLEEAKKYIAEL